MPPLSIDFIVTVLFFRCLNIKKVSATLRTFSGKWGLNFPFYVKFYLVFRLFIDNFDLFAVNLLILEITIVY